MSIVNSTIIRPPVSIQDVRKMLGEQSTDLGELCQSPNINMWAKYKPVRHSAIGSVTDLQRKNLNYGITNIPVWGGRSGSFNRMGNFWFGVDTSSTNYPECGIQTEYWTYRRPIGGATSPFRLLDFVKDNTYGYKHDVEPPIGGCKDVVAYISASGSLTFNFVGQGSGQGDGYVVPLGELSGEGIATGDFDNLYLSVMVHVHKTNNTDVYYVCSRPEQWSSTNSTSVTGTVTQAIGLELEGQREVFPFLSSEIFSSYTTPQAGSTETAVAMFKKSNVSIVIQKAKAEPSGFSAWYVNASDKVLHASFTLTNTGDADFRAKYTVLFSKYDTFPDSDTVTGTGEIFINNGNSAGCSVSPNIWISDTAKYYRNGYARLIVTIASGYGIIFYESTSAAARIIWQNDPTPSPFD